MVANRIDDIDRMHELVRRVAGDWFDHMVTATIDMKPVQELMLDLLYRHSLTMVGTAEQLRGIWQLIDACPHGVEYVLGLAQRFYLYYDCDATRQTQLTELGPIIQAMSCFQSDKSVIPTEQRQELPQFETVKNLYSANRWFIPLLLLATQPPVVFVTPAQDNAGTPEGRE